jgi:hypothetical protein
MGTETTRCIQAEKIMAITMEIPKMAAATPIITAENSPSPDDCSLSVLALISDQADVIAQLDRRIDGENSGSVVIAPAG